MSEWNEGVTPRNAPPDTPTGSAQKADVQKLGEVGREQPKQEKLWKMFQRWDMLPICRGSIK